MNLPVKRASLSQHFGSELGVPRISNTQWNRAPGSAKETEPHVSANAVIALWTNMVHASSNDIVLW